MNPINLFLLIAAFQGFVLSLLIIFSRFFKSKANDYLGYTLGVLSLLMMNIFLSNIRVFETYPLLNLVDTTPWAFLFSAFFFCYIVKVIHHDLANSKKLKWLFLPFALFALFRIVLHLEIDFMLYEISFEAKELLYYVFFGLEDLGTYLFNIILLVWSFRLLKKSPNKKTLTERWVKKLWWFICIITITWIILFIVDVFLIESYPVLDHYIIYDLYILAIQLSLFVYWIAYTGLYKLRIANERKEILDILHDKPQHEVIVPSANFLENNSYFVQLEQLLSEQHIYRDPNLSRELVADKLGISAGYLSQIVNKVTQKNFTAYINSFRVEETKRMILDEQFDKYSLLSIGLESGFKSKTTFYNSFKKETGFTPNEFKNNHK